MFQFHSILEQLRESNKYNENASLVKVLLNSLNQKNYHVRTSDLEVIANFVYDEMRKLIDAIRQSSDYKIIDDISYYIDQLMALFMYIKDNHYDVSESDLDFNVRDIINMITKERVIETAVDELFQQDRIDKEHIIKVIDIVKSITNEYQRGKFFQGLLYYKNNFNKVTSEARYEISNYISAELERYLEKKNNLNEDEINCLEIAADLCKFFPNDKIILLLKEILYLNHNNIRYYAMETLLNAKDKIEKDIILDMANDLVYANLTCT